VGASETFRTVSLGSSYIEDNHRLKMCHSALAHTLYKLTLWLRLNEEGPGKLMEIATLPNMYQMW
jgi:hypothetical protein